MVRIIKETIYTGEKKYIEAAGLSTDSKPISNIITGSKFIEVDTGNKYMFAEGVSPAWHKVKLNLITDRKTDRK